MTTRGTSEQRGWVNFPTDRENTDEGGMYVQLVVVPKPAREPAVFGTKEWMLCCSSLPRVTLGEDLIAEDPGAVLDFHYPEYRPKNRAPIYDSIDYLAVITLGSTGWSNGDWHCTVEDLTDEGAALYLIMQQLYGERGELYLMTWLDT